MRRGAGVVAAREHRGEPLVVGLDRRADRRAQPLDERLRLARLLAVLAAQGQRHADDDELRLLRGDHGQQLCEPGVGGGTLDVVTGRATVPVGSETATPVRAEP